MHVFGLSLSLLLAFSSFQQGLGQSLPGYVAMIGGREGGPINREAFLAQQGIAAMRYISGNHWEPIPVDSFSLVIIRNAAVLTRVHNKGQLFTAGTRAQLRHLTSHDKVLIHSIYGRGLDNITVFIKPLEFIIE